MKTAICLAIRLSIFACILACQDLPAQPGGIFWMAEGPMAADFDGNGEVSFGDFLAFVKGYNTKDGEPGFDARLDLNGNGAVDFDDFLSFSAAFGSRRSEPVRTGYVVYVADPADFSVIAFDPDTHLVLDYLPFRVPTSVRVSQDQRSIYVSEAFGLFVLNTEHKVLFSVPTESQGKIALSPDGRFAYVTEERNGLLRVVDLEAQAAVDTIEVGEVPGDLEVAPDGKRLYVANARSRDISVVDLERREEVVRIAIDAIPVEVAIAPDGLRAYVTNFDRGAVSVLDLTQDRVVGTIHLDEEDAQGLAFSPDGKELYVASGGSLLAVDAQRNLILRALKVADATSSIGVSPDGSRLYIGALWEREGGPGLVAVDLVNWRALGRMRGFGFPIEIQFRKVLPPQQKE